MIGGEDLRKRGRGEEKETRILGSRTHTHKLSMMRVDDDEEESHQQSAAARE